MDDHQSAEGSESSSAATFDDSFFGRVAAAFHRVGKSNVLPTFVSILLVLISLLQFALLALRPSWSWNDDSKTVFEILNVINEPYSLFSSYLEVLEIYVLTASLALVCSSGLLLWNAVGMLNNRESLIVLLPYLNSTFVILHNVCFLPGCLMLLRSVSCSIRSDMCWNSTFSVLAQAFSVLGLVLLLSADFLYSALFIKTKYSKELSPSACPYPLFTTMWSICRVACVLLYVFLDGTSAMVVAPMVQFAVAVVFASHVFYELPFFDMNINWLWFIISFLAASWSFIAFLYSSAIAPTANVAWAFLAAPLVFIPLSVWLLRQDAWKSHLFFADYASKLKEIEEHDEAASAASAEPFSDGPQEAGIEIRLDFHTALRYGKSHQSQVPDDADMIADVLGLSLKSSNYATGSLLNYALFLFNFCPQHKNALLKAVSDVERHGLSGWYKLATFTSLRYELRLSLFSGFFSEEAREIAVQLKMVQRARENLQNLLLRFFRDLAKHRMSEGRMSGVVSAVCSEKKSLISRLQSLLERFPRSPAVLRENALFFENILGDPFKAQQYLEMAEQYEAERLEDGAQGGGGSGGAKFQRPTNASHLPSSRRSRIAPVSFADRDKSQLGSSLESLSQESSDARQAGGDDDRKSQTSGSSKGSSGSRVAIFRDRVANYRSPSVLRLIIASTLTVFVLLIMVAIAFGVLVSVTNKFDGNLTEVYRASRLQELGQGFSFRGTMSYISTLFARPTDYAIAQKKLQTTYDLGVFVVDQLVVQNPPTDDSALMDLWKSPRIPIDVSNGGGQIVLTSAWDALQTLFQNVYAYKDIPFGSFTTANWLWVVYNAASIGVTLQDITHAYVDRFNSTFYNQLVVTNSIILGVSLALLIIVPLVIIIPALISIRRERKRLYELFESVPKSDASRALHSLSSQYSQTTSSRSEETDVNNSKDFRSHSVSRTMVVGIVLWLFLFVTVIAFSTEQYVLYSTSGGVGQEISGSMKLSRDFTSGCDWTVIMVFFTTLTRTLASRIQGLMGALTNRKYQTDLKQFRFGLPSANQKGIYTHSNMLPGVVSAFRQAACTSVTSPLCYSVEDVLVSADEMFTYFYRSNATTYPAKYRTPAFVTQMVNWDSRVSGNLEFAANSLQSDYSARFSAMNSRVSIYFGIIVPLSLILLCIMIMLSNKIQDEFRQVQLLMLMLPYKCVQDNRAIHALLSSGQIHTSEAADDDAKVVDMSEALPDALVEVDRSEKIVLVNRAAGIMFGCSREALVGQSIRHLFSELDAEKVGGFCRMLNEAEVSGHATSDIVTEKLMMVRTQDGTVESFPAQLCASVQRGFLILVIHDRTQRVKQDSLIKEEQARSEKLLKNIFPEEVASQLKSRIRPDGSIDTTRPISKRYPQVSVLFTDIAGFTESTKDASPDEMVRVLNDLVIRFDRICKKHHVEKIKTIGDAFFGVAGFQDVRRNTQAEDAVECALEMIECLKEFVLKEPLAATWQIRCGVNTGSVIGGVIGEDKFAFDCWASTVNIANKMESTGVVGRVQVTRETLALIHDKYAYEEREKIFVKGVGDVSTALIIGRKNI
eukprot:ANDGO_03995.mRNA.1 Adenylate cyclase